MKELPQLKADVAGADHDQMLGHRLQIQERGAGQKIHLVQTGDWRYRWARAGRQDKAISGKHAIAHTEALFVFEVGFAADELPPIFAYQVFVLVMSKRADELVLFIHDAGGVQRLSPRPD